MPLIRTRRNRASRGEHTHPTISGLAIYNPDGRPMAERETLRRQSGHGAALLIAWLGAGAFAASLVWFIYSYVIRFGADGVDARAARLRPLVADVALFSVFALHHSLFARPRIKQRIQRLVPPDLERSLYTWIASLLFIVVCTWWQPVAGVFYDVSGPWRAIAYSLQAVGVVLTVRASAALDALDLAGVRPVLRAITGASPPAHVPLETRGLYGFVRHPLYFAWALFVFTTPTMTGTRAVMAVVSTAYLAIAIPWEERSLSATFGKEYDAYKQKVRWRMVPGVY